MAGSETTKERVERVIATHESAVNAPQSMTLKVKDLSGMPTTLRNSMKELIAEGTKVELPGRARVHVSDEQFNNIRSAILKDIQAELGNIDPRAAWMHVEHSW